MKQQFVFKTKVDKHMALLIGNTVFLVSIWGALALFHPSHWDSPPHRYFALFAAVSIAIEGVIFISQQYRYTIYEDKIKFPVYWRLKNRTGTVHKESIISIRYISERPLHFSGIQITTKNNRKYLIVKPYDKQVFPYLKEMMGDRWQEVYKG